MDSRERESSVREFDMQRVAHQCKAGGSRGIHGDAIPKMRSTPPFQKGPSLKGDRRAHRPESGVDQTLAGGERGSVWDFVGCAGGVIRKAESINDLILQLD